MFDIPIESCVVVPAKKSALGVFTIPAGLDVNDPSPGDAASGVKRSPLCGWEDACFKCDECGKLALCDYCNIATCVSCNPAALSAASWVCVECKEEMTDD